MRENKSEKCDRKWISIIFYYSRLVRRHYFRRRCHCRLDLMRYKLWKLSAAVYIICKWNMLFWKDQVAYSEKNRQKLKNTKRQTAKRKEKKDRKKENETITIQQIDWPRKVSKLNLKERLDIFDSRISQFKEIRIKTTTSSTYTQWENS